jgi:hypothetical protein
MNTYISRTKDAILDYLGKAKQTEIKIAEGRKIYQPDSMDKEEKRLRGELAKARQETEARIDAIYREASASAREWGKLDGSKLTDDARLLQGQGVTPEQFNQLVERYEDNYTMLDALRKYGEARNAEATKEAREAGDRSVVIKTPYNVQNIPGPDSKMQEWDNMRARAAYFLNVADGTGFTADFERTFARGAADKEFEAWGTEPTKPTKQDNAAAGFAAAWGFGPK